jgi:hypothetical protein
VGSIPIARSSLRPENVQGYDWHGNLHPWERYRSGQTGQTVNLLAYAFGGSNPPLSTIFAREGSQRSHLARASQSGTALIPELGACLSLNSPQARERISGLDEIGLDLQSQLVVLDGLWYPTRLLQGEPQVGVRLGEVGFDPQRLLKVRDGFLNPARSRQSGTEVGVGLGEIGFDS